MAIPLRTTLPSANAFLRGTTAPLHFLPPPAPSVRCRVRNADQILVSSTLRKHLNGSSSSVSSVAATTGAVGSTSEVSAEDLKSSLESVQVFDITGKAVPIIDLWRNRKAVVAFARHFGCVLCRKRADLLASKKELMDAAGVTLVLIGPGSVEQANTFVQQTNFKGEVYADPNRSSYDALRFAYGIASTFTPSAGLKIIQLYMEGYRQDWELSFEKNTRTKGGWQQGGVLIAGPGVDNIIYIHKDKEAGDDPDIEDIVKACCSN